MSFIEKLQSASRANDSLLCIGLDPDPGRMPVADVFEFNRAIIDATQDLVCAYKPNLAFYEALGVQGMEALYKTLDHIPDSIPAIGDAKRGDIGNTAKAYATSLFEDFGFDAVTVNPYLGHDSVSPFLEYADRGVFVLCRTSNPGSTDFQTLMVRRPEDRSEIGSEGWPLYREVASKCKEWNLEGNVGLVVGATYPEELKEIRGQCPDMPILVPGVGAQGGDLEAAVINGRDSGGGNLLVASSRQVLYASQSRDFPQAARKAAMELRDQINRYRGR